VPGLFLLHKSACLFEGLLKTPEIVRLWPALSIKAQAAVKRPVHWLYFPCCSHLRVIGRAKIRQERVHQRMLNGYSV